MEETILKALNWRYAVQIFDPSKQVDEKHLQVILESGRLAPSSIGIEPWKFFVVENQEIRTKLKESSYGQPKVTDAAYLIVIAYRTDVRENVANDKIAQAAKVHKTDPESLKPLRDMIEGAIANKTDVELETWVKAQAYIPLGMMVETAALLGIDSGPMEGFDPNQVDEILGLKEKRVHATAMLAVGYRGDDPAAARAKVRRDFSQVVEFIK